MKRTLWILCMAAASLAAKDRAWQTGQLLDKNYNSYFKVSQTSKVGASGASFVSGDNGMLATNTRASDGDVSFEDYVLQSTDFVYLVEFAHFKTFQLPNLSVLQPVKFAIDKNKIYIMDLDRHEFETSILKQVPRRGPVLASSAQPAPSVAKVDSKTDPAKVDQSKVDQSKVDNAKNASKSGDLFARGAPAADDSNPPKPKPAPAPPAQTVAAVKQDMNKQDVNKQDVKPTPAVQTQQAPAKPDPKLQASVTKPAKVDTPPPPKPAPVSKPEPKVEAAITKPVQRQEPAKPEGPVVKASTKDRAWQSGNLLSVANNSYFFNVTYTSDIEGSSWPFSQGSDGRMTVTGQIATTTNSPYTYDNYVIESEYVAYLVQRMRPKTSPAVRLPGTKALKFAVDKGKMWVIDEQGVEYETKVIKLIQKDAIVDPLTRSAAR